MTALLADFGWLYIFAIVIAVLLTSILHGATGLAGGFLMGAAIAPIVGVQDLVPVMSIALLISHSSRALFNIRDFDRTAYLWIIVPAMPFLVAIASFYDRIPTNWLAICLGITILIAIPMRHWTKSRGLKAGKRELAIGGVVLGSVSAASLGPGILLAPVMLGYGLTKEAFVATLAATAVSINLGRVAVFGGMDLFSADKLWLGLIIGALTIPGNWIGRTYLRRMTTERHAVLVDILILAGALNFFYLAVSVS